MSQVVSVSIGHCEKPSIAWPHRGCGHGCFAAQIRTGGAGQQQGIIRLIEHCLWRPCKKDPAPVSSRAGSNVNDPIGRHHCLPVVFHHNDGVALSHQPAHDSQQTSLVLGMRTRLGGRIAWVEMTHDTCADAGMAMEEATDMVDVPASLAGVSIAALFRETSRPGETKVSLRSKGPWAVNGIAVAHGGGGHPPAAGCTVHASLEETRDRILAEVEEMLTDGA